MGVVDSGALHHTCFIVHDVEKTAQAMSESLAIGPWNVWTIEPTESTVRGEARPFSFRVALAEVGGCSYELLAPLTGESEYTEHLERHGEGFHHTCLIYPSLEAMRGAKAELVKQDRELVQSGSLGDAAEFAYFMIPEIGSILELLYLGELPPPETTIG
jgi:hypothetical protein